MLEGKQHRKTMGHEGDRFNMTARVAYNLKEQMVQRMIEGTWQFNPQNRLFDAVFGDYLEAIKPLESPKTVASKRYNYDKHIRPRVQGQKVAAFDGPFWQRVINEMLNAGAAPTTCQKIKNLLAKIYDHAIRSGWAVANPAKEIRLPAYDDRVELDLTLEEMKRLYATIVNWPEPIYRGIFTFLLHGRRLGEVLNLTWENINQERQSYTIAAKHNKARKNMTYALLPPLQEALKCSPTIAGLVWPSPVTGKVLVDVKKPWLRIKKAAGINEERRVLRLHDLRHIVGYVGANNGLSEEVLAAILGHSSTRVTRRYYQIRAETAATGIEKIHGLLG
jgi:integrase